MFIHIVLIHYIINVMLSTAMLQEREIFCILKSMKLANYHTHCTFDDGTESMENFAASAAEKSIDILGFSCHTPWFEDDHWHMKAENVERFFQEADRLKEVYRGRMEVYRGMELDYIDDTKELQGSSYKDRLDYTIGSVHLFRDQETGEFLSVDGPPEEILKLRNNTFKGSGKALVSYYFRCLNELMELHSFDILGHFDLIKKLNPKLGFFDPQERWYRDLNLEALDTAAYHGVRIEVNTGTIARGIMDEPYPAPWLLKHCRERNIPMVISSDAHSPKDIDCWFGPARDLLMEAGYREIDVLTGGSWTAEAL